MISVSVIMSVYKEPEAWLRYSIDSILAQTFRDFEFIIVNDCPGREETARVLADYAARDSRVRLVANERNIGLTASLNIGLRQASGKYIARMDADDWSALDRFALQYAFMEANPDIGVLGSGIKMFGADTRTILFPERHEQFFVFHDYTFCHSSVFIRRAMLQEHGIEYDTAFRYAQDFDLWERLYRVTRFANLPQVLVHYRVSEQNVSHAKGKEQAACSAVVKVRAFNYYCQRSGLHFRLTPPLTPATLRAYRECLHSGAIPYPYRFLYLLYRSMACGRLTALCYLFRSGDAFHMAARQVLRLVAINTIKRQTPPALAFSL